MTTSSPAKKKKKLVAACKLPIFFVLFPLDIHDVSRVIRQTYMVYGTDEL